MASKSIADRWYLLDKATGQRVPASRHGKGMRYRARYRDAAGKEHARHFDRKRDAQRWLDEVTASVMTGQYVNPGAGRITFRAFYDQWVELQIWVPSTRENADRAVSSVSFAAMPLSTIRLLHVQAWVKSMSSSGLAASTIKTRFVTVRSVFRAAVQDKRIPEDPTQGVALPRPPKAETGMRIPTPEEVGRLLEHADSTRLSTRHGFRAFVAVAAFAGLRLGEVCGLQVHDIDFMRRAIQVRRQTQRDGKGYRLAPPKWESERVVFVPDELLEVLAQHIAESTPSGAPDRWLFENFDGSPLHDNTVTWRWRATRKAAGLEGFTLHSLRHFYASGLIAANCDVVTVQRALGHAKATTTLDTYSHLWPTAEDRTRAASAAMWSGAVTDVRPAKVGG